jgi:hypothetical protein
MDRETNTLATRGLEELFPVVLLCQVFVLAVNILSVSVNQNQVTVER